MEERWGRGGESGGGAGVPTLGGPASAAVPGPRQSPAAEGARCAAGTEGGTRAGVDPGCRPAPTGSYLGLLLGHGCARRRGGNGESDSAGAGESRSRPAALPPQMLAGPRFAPQIPERWLAGGDHVADARARRACPGRRARARRGRGSWQLGMRHGAGPRAIPAVPTPGNAPGSGFGAALGPPGSSGQRGRGARGAHGEPRPSGRPGATSETRPGALPRPLAATSVPWSTDLVPHLLR